jgi:ABC-type cobalamin/Fe3+-siderophores transport system ATPase subunit
VPSVVAVYSVVTKFHATGSMLEKTPKEYVLTEEKLENLYGAQMK